MKVEWVFFERFFFFKPFLEGSMCGESFKKMKSAGLKDCLIIDSNCLTFAINLCKKKREEGIVFLYIFFWNRNKGGQAGEKGRGKRERELKTLIFLFFENLVVLV